MRIVCVRMEVMQVNMLTMGSLAVGNPTDCVVLLSNKYMQGRVVARDRK